VKLFLLYITLVGVPLVGLLGILRVGETLDVPVSIGGIWSVDASTAQGVQRSCTPIELPHERPEMTVFQSGRHVQLQFNDIARTSLTGRLHARTLTVRQVLPSEAKVENICGAAMPAVLHVQLQRGTGEADQLSGSWRMPECDVCSPLPFRALRLVVR
jgi:hypothetical protein